MIRPGHIMTKRILNGFLLKIEDDKARVVYISNSIPWVYDVDAKLLLDAGINLPNQPFQMEETYEEDSCGNFIIAWRFLALAKMPDAFIEKLEFNEERKRKRALILNEFGNPLPKL